MSNTEIAALQRTDSAQLVKIFVLANPDFYLEGLLAMLARSPESNLIACVKPGDDCWNKFTSYHVDVLLIHSQAVPEGSDCFARFLQHAPHLKIVVFGHDMSDEFLLRIMRAGAVGYLNEKMSGEHLLRAIRQVHDGALWVERRLLEKLIFRVTEIESIINQAIESIRNVLTKREAEIYRHVLGGLATKEIANEMNLSEQSIKLHLRNIFKKFDVTNKHQLILLTFQKVCPVSNVLRLFRIVMDKQRLAKGETALISDPLVEISGS